MSVLPDITIMVNWAEKRKKKRKKSSALPSDWRSHRQRSHWSSGYHGLFGFLARVAGARNHLDNNTAHATSVQRFKAPFSSGHTTAAGRDARSPLHLRRWARRRDEAACTRAVSCISRSRSSRPCRLSSLRLCRATRASSKSTRGYVPFGTTTEGNKTTSTFQARRWGKLD